MSILATHSTSCSWQDCFPSELHPSISFLLAQLLIDEDQSDLDLGKY